jgi:hypothetical protein
MLSKDKPQSRKDNLVVQEIEGEVLIYDLNINKAFCLNDTSAQVWQACDGTKSVTEISQLISKEQNSPVGEDFVWLALDQLKKNDLLSNSEEIVPNFNGMSRREVVKKVGLSTMLAIPFIVSLTAPLAANAQSTGPAPGTACDTRIFCQCKFNKNNKQTSCQDNNNNCVPRGSTIPNGQCVCNVVDLSVSNCIPESDKSDDVICGGTCGPKN